MKFFSGSCRPDGIINFKNGYSAWECVCFILNDYVLNYNSFGHPLKNLTNDLHEMLISLIPEKLFIYYYNHILESRASKVFGQNKNDKKKKKK